MQRLPVTGGQIWVLEWLAAWLGGKYLGAACWWVGPGNRGGWLQVPGSWGWCQPAGGRI